HNTLDDVRLNVQFKRPGASSDRGWSAGLEHQQVGLEGSEPPLSHLLSQPFDIVQTPHSWAPDNLLEKLGMSGAIHAAVRPVHRKTVAQLAAKKLVNRHPQRFGLDV